MCFHRPETEAERNASDHEKLLAALNRCDRLSKEWCEDAKTIMAAARKHLATLPKDIVTRLRAAKKDDRLSTGALYGEAADEIERLRNAGHDVKRLLSGT